MTDRTTFERAVQALVARGASEDETRRLLTSLGASGFDLAEAVRDELVCRWVDATVRAVPPEADTIIRTITTTRDGHSTSTTHWLEGLRSPRSASSQ